MTKPTIRPTLYTVLSPLFFTLLSLEAAEIQKANNLDPIQNGSSWVGGVAPTNGDIAVWDSTISTSNLNQTLGSSVNWGGLKFESLQGDLTINRSASFNFGGGAVSPSIELTSGTGNVQLLGNQSTGSTGVLNVSVAANRYLTVEGNFVYSNQFHKNGAGTMVLIGTSDNSGTRVVLNEGELLLAKSSTADAHALGGGDHYVNGGTLKLGGTGSDQIYYGGNVHMAGGVFDLAGLNEGFNVLAGSGGVIQNSVAGTTSVLIVGQNNGAGSFGGIIQDGAGAVRFVKTGSEVQHLTGISNTYSGGTSVTGGILRVWSDASLGQANGGLELNGGVLHNNDNSTTLNLNASRTITIGAAGGGLRAGYGQHINVYGQITSSGAGNFSIMNDTHEVILHNPNNNYAGATVIGGTGYENNAALRLGASNVIPDASAVIFNAGGTYGSTSNTARLNLNGFSETVASLETISGRGIITGGGTLTITGNATTTFNGVIDSGIHVVHSGPGQLTLEGEGDNGAVRGTVNQGTLVLAKNSSSAIHALGGAAHSVNAGGVLRLAGTGNDQIYFDSTVTVNAGGVLDFNGRSEGWRNFGGAGLLTNSAAGTNSTFIVGESSTDAQTYTFSGQINDGDTGGTLNLRKVGASRLVLTGNSTMSGPTTVEQGVLAGTGSLSQSDVTVFSGATLSPGSQTAESMFGVGTLSIKSLSLQSGSKLQANLASGGNAAMTDRVKLSGALDLDGALLEVAWGGNSGLIGQMLFLTEGATSSSGYFANVGAADDSGLFGATSYALTSFSGQEFALFYGANYATQSFSGGYDLMMIAVPEPSKSFLTMVALGSLMMHRRRKQS